MNKYHRRSIRLAGYDYTQVGAYFLTFCAHERECLFADIATEGELNLTPNGQIVQEEWLRSAEIRREIELDVYVVMPNHFHGIIVINTDVTPHDAVAIEVGAHGCAPLPHTPLPLHRPARSLGSFVAGFKSAVTARINTIQQTPGQPLWQRNYYEHIIRNERELNAIRDYIEKNPLSWALDSLNPAAPQQARPMKILP